MDLRLFCFDVVNLGDHFCVMVFQGANQATSGGWRRRVALGKRHTKTMICFEHASVTDLLTCDDKLSPIRTSFLSCLQNFGSIRVKNQLVKAWNYNRSRNNMQENPFIKVY